MQLNSGGRDRPKDPINMELLLEKRGGTPIKGKGIRKEIMETQLQL